MRQDRPRLTSLPEWIVADAERCHPARQWDAVRGLMKWIAEATVETDRGPVRVLASLDAAPKGSASRTMWVVTARVAQPESSEVGIAHDLKDAEAQAFARLGVAPILAD